MKEWHIGFSRINEQNIYLKAETEAEAIIKAFEKWFTYCVPKINYISLVGVSEKWEKWIK